MSFFRNIPSHISKEILLIQCGLSSCDSGDIKDSVDRLREQKTKVSAISFLGQIYLSEWITKSTGGILLNNIGFKFNFLKAILMLF